MLIGLVALIAGLALVVWGAERFTDGAIHVAASLTLSTFFVGAVVSGLEPFGARAVPSRSATSTCAAWSLGVLSTIRGPSARRVRACDGLLKAGTWGSGIVRFGLGWGCRLPVGFRFRVIPGIPERSLIPGSSWTSSRTSSATRKLSRARTDRHGGLVRAK